jgi:hypothetical protein
MLPGVMPVIDMHECLEVVLASWRGYEGFSGTGDRMRLFRESPETKGEKTR